MPLHCSCFKKQGSCTLIVPAANTLSKPSAVKYYFVLLITIARFRYAAKVNHTRYAAIPISVYNIVHTTGNNQSGGASICYHYKFNQILQLHLYNTMTHFSQKIYTLQLTLMVTAHRKPLASLVESQSIFLILSKSSSFEFA